MKKIFSILLMGVALLGMFTSCDEPTYPKKDDAEGQLSISSLYIDVVTGEDIRRSTIDITNYTIRILNKKTGAQVHEWKYSSKPEIITLPVDVYTIEVFNHEVEDAAFDSPYYYASKDVEILKNSVSEIGVITCRLSNVKVSIQYTDRLKSLIKDGKDVFVDVVVGKSGKLTFAYDETRAGFFKFDEGSNTLVATFRGTVDGTYMSEYKTITDVEKGQHRIITFDAKKAPDPEEEFGHITTSGFAVVSSVTVVDLTRDVRVTEDPVDPDDMIRADVSDLKLDAKGGAKTVSIVATDAWTANADQSWVKLSVSAGNKGTTNVNVSAEENTSEEARSANVMFKMGAMVAVVKVTQQGKGAASDPTIESTTLDLSGVNTIYDGMKAIVNLNAPNGIAHVNVTIDSPSLTKEDLIEVGLDSEFDLAYPGRVEPGLKALGFPVGNDVIGKQTVVFDISQFMGLLTAFKGEHHFILEIIDSNGKAAVATIRLLAQ